jgi:hypothetical protein
MGFQDDYAPSGAAFVVTGVEPRGSIGLRAGDRIALRGLPFAARWRLRDVHKGYGGVAGEQWVYGVERGATRFLARITVRPVPPQWNDWASWVQVISAVWGLLFVALLAIRRPDSIEARLLALIVLFLLNVNDLTGTFLPWPALEYFIHSFGNLFLAVPIVCLTVYAARIGRPLSRARWLLSALSVVFAVVLALEVAVLYGLGYLFALPVFSVAQETWTGVAGLVLSLLCLALAAIAARGDDRQRALWVLAGVTPVWAYYIGIDVIWNYVTINWPIAYAALTLAVAWLPAALTYAVLSRRCIDVGYVLNRAVIYGALSIVVLGMFVIVEWALTAWVQNVSRSTSVVINIAVALVLGLSLRFMHQRIEYVVDRVFFRRRYENEAALRRFAHEAPFITNIEVLLSRTEAVIERHAEASWVRIIMADDVDENDPAVLTMRASHEGVDLHRCESCLDGELAYPLTARGRLLGVLVCGPKEHGESYDPDERNALDAVARSLGAALDALRKPAEDPEAVALLLEIRDLLASLKSERLGA